MSDGLVIVEYSQDADSFGWSVVALIHANYKPGVQRWGVLDATVGTDRGELPDSHSSSNPYGTHGRTREECVRGAWNLVDWYPSEDAARDAYDETRSRQW